MSLLAAIVSNLVGEAVGAILLGACTIGVPTMVTALVRHAVPGTRYALALTWMTVAFAVGQTLGPLLGGSLADAHGLTVAVLAACPLLAAAAAAAAAYRPARLHT